MTGTRRIGIYASPVYAYCRDVIAGVSETALQCDCRLQLIDSNLPLENFEAFDLAGLIGLVATQDKLEMLRRQKFPIINVSGRLAEIPFPQVLPDNRRIGAMAAEHLIEQSVQSFACVEMGDVYFSKLRCGGFVEALAAAGKRCTVLNAMANENVSVIVQWALAAPKPAALFVAVDREAVALYEAFFNARLRIPEDVLIVGVDNETMICQMMNPPLSSVDCNPREVGRKAAQLLLWWLDTGEAAPAVTLIPPKGVVARPSSTLSLTADELVNHALLIIRAQTPERLTVKRLLNQLGVSRRTLDARFAAAGKKSPAAEILQAQIERAQHLLVDTGLSLDEVAAGSGLATQRLLRTVFRRHLGESPTAYRQRLRKADQN